MRGGCDETTGTTSCGWKKGMKRLVGTENLEFCSGYYNGPTLFRNLLKRSR